MNSRVPYKGFIIDARVGPGPGGHGWIWNFSIEKHDGEGVTDTPFYHREQPATQSTEESALAVAVAHAKKQIDDGFTPAGG